MVPVVVLAHQAACPRPAVAVAPHEPYVTRGPTELVVGLYVQGGAVIPNCPQEPRGPYGGTVTVSSRAGRVVARRTLAGGGRLFVLSLAPGKYTVNARIAGGVRLQPVSVTVRRGHTIRWDLFEDVP